MMRASLYAVAVIALGTPRRRGCARATGPAPVRVAEDHCEDIRDQCVVPLPALALQHSAHVLLDIRLLDRLGGPEPGYCPCRSHRLRTASLVSHTGGSSSRRTRTARLASHTGGRDA